MKYAEIKGKKFSKLVIGTNAIYGRSHFSQARDHEYKERFNDLYLADFLNICINRGINTIESSYNDRICNLVSQMKKKLNKPLYLIGNTRIDKTSEIKSHQVKLKKLIEFQSDICLVHSQVVEHHENLKGEIPGLRRMIDKIHKAGLIAGISCHKNSIVEHCEEYEYGIDTYLYPLNKVGYVYPGYIGNETVEERLELMHKIDKPLILMKALACGRLTPAEGLDFVIKNMRENDVLSLGLGSIEEAEEIFEILGY